MFVSNRVSPHLSEKPVLCPIDVTTITNNEDHEPVKLYPKKLCASCLNGTGANSGGHVPDVDTRCEKRESSGSKSGDPVAPRALESMERKNSSPVSNATKGSANES